MNFIFQLCYLVPAAHFNKYFLYSMTFCFWHHPHPPNKYSFTLESEFITLSKVRVINSFFFKNNWYTLKCVLNYTIFLRFEQILPSPPKKKKLVMYFCFQLINIFLTYSFCLNKKSLFLFICRLIALCFQFRISVPVQKKFYSIIGLLIRLVTVIF